MVRCIGKGEPTTPFSFSMAARALSTLSIVTKPKPRERSLCAHRQGFWACQSQGGRTHSLVVHDDDLFNATAAAELVFEVNLLRADGDAKDAEDFRLLRIGGRMARSVRSACTAASGGMSERYTEGCRVGAPVAALCVSRTTVRITAIGRCGAVVRVVGLRCGRRYANRRHGLSVFAVHGRNLNKSESEREGRKPGGLGELKGWSSRKGVLPLLRRTGKRLTTSLSLSSDLSGVLCRKPTFRATQKVGLENRVSASLQPW